MLQNHVGDVMFAKSVGVLKLKMTACPLSENRLLKKIGGGNVASDDKSTTVILVVEY